MPLASRWWEGALGNSVSSAGGSFARDLTSGLVRSETINIAYGGKQSLESIATDAFGNALGNAIANPIAQSMQDDRIQALRVAQATANVQASINAGGDGSAILFGPSGGGLAPSAPGSNQWGITMPGAGNRYGIGSPPSTGDSESTLFGPGGDIDGSVQQSIAGLVPQTIYGNLHFHSPDVQTQTDPGLDIIRAQRIAQMEADAPTIATTPTAPSIGATPLPQIRAGIPISPDQMEVLIDPSTFDSTPGAGVTVNSVPYPQINVRSLDDAEATIQNAPGFFDGLGNILHAYEKGDVSLGGALGMAGDQIGETLRGIHPKDAVNDAATQLSVYGVHQGGVLGGAALYTGAVIGGVDELLPNSPREAAVAVAIGLVAGPLVGKAISGLEGLAAASGATAWLAQDAGSVAGKVVTSFGQTSDGWLGGYAGRIGARASITDPTIPSVAEGVLLEQPSGIVVTSIAATSESEAAATNFVTLYRGDATAQTQFLSKLAESQGVDASNAAIANAESQGSVSYLFENHGLNSGESPYISLSTSQEVAESFARGIDGTQAGYVTEFRLPSNLAEANFENPNSWEREYLAPTQVDGRYIFNQYQVTPKTP